MSFLNTGITRWYPVSFERKLSDLKYPPASENSVIILQNSLLVRRTGRLSATTGGPPIYDSATTSRLVARMKSIVRRVTSAVDMAFFAGLMSQSVHQVICAEL